MSKPTYVLGTGLSHDGSSCLLRDGEIAVVIEKERFTRIKQDGYNDAFTLAECLSVEGIGWEDIDLLVQNANFGSFKYGNDWFRGERHIPSYVPVATISHHLAHAYCAFYLSPFDEASVLVVDGCGNAFEDCVDLDGVLAECPPHELRTLWLEKDSYYVADTKGLATKYKDFSIWGKGISEYPMHPPISRDSMGGLYSAVSNYVFGGSKDLGKLMGLAPYGKAVYPYQLMSVASGRLKVNYDWMKHFTERCKSSEDFKERFQYFADIACMTQQAVEEAVVELVTHRYELHPSKNLCFSGGVALNAVANTKILRDTPFENIFVPPPAHDAGLAIGCAYYGWVNLLGKERVKHSGSPYMGKSYESEATSVVEAVRNIPINVEVSEPENLNAKVAKLIADGKVVGWYKGRSEVGPRALGHRSILGSPSHRELHYKINNDIKNREDFRPFAPSVLAEDAKYFFDMEVASPYMLLVFPVKNKWRDTLSAVTHVDGTARVQTVEEGDDADFYDLLKEVKRETGIGMVLNTSFNKRDEPMVETPDYAVQMFLDTPIDALVLNEHLLIKRS